MCVRLPAILILTLILSLGVTIAPTAIQGRPSVSLTECNPPAGLQLPVSQGIVVRCHLRGQVKATHVRFLVNQVA